MQDPVQERDEQRARRDRRASGWPATLNRAVGAEVKRLRKDHGWTQEQLADRLRALGVDFSVSAVVNLEAYRRQGVALHELIALAAVLGVDPISLAFPDRREHDKSLPDRGDVELLPGRAVDATSAVEWFVGLHLPSVLMIDEPNPDTALTRYEQAAAGLALLRKHEALARDVDDVAGLRGDDVEDFYRARVDRLRRLRRQIVAAGWPLPALPYGLRTADVDGPRIPVNPDDKEDGS